MSTSHTSRKGDSGFLQDFGVSFVETTISTAGIAGQQTLYTVTGSKLRITELTIRNAGTNNTVVTLTGSAGIMLTIDIPATTTREWESVIGRVFTNGQALIVRTSDITGGSTYISGSGIDK